MWGKEASPHGITRKKARELQAESPLNRLIGGLPIASKMSAASQDAVVRYLELLDHVLEDRIIDDGEVGEGKQAQMQADKSRIKSIDVRLEKRPTIAARSRW